MRSLRFGAVSTTLVVLASLMLLASAPGGASAQTGSDETGYGARKPVFGGSGPTSGWGAIGTVVREAMASYGWDVQLCRSCAGAARAARLVAGAEVPATRGAGAGLALDVVDETRRWGIDEAFQRHQRSEGSRYRRES